MVIKAAISDHIILSEITKSSKAYWGYSTEQMALWDEELTITPTYIEQNMVYKFMQDKNPIAYYSLIKISATIIKLDNLFVIPQHIGKGVGKILLDDILIRSVNMGFNEIILDADPNAYLFYKKNGFKIIGQKETSIKNRYLQVMQKKLT